MDSQSRFLEELCPTRHAVRINGHLADDPTNAKYRYVAKVWVHFAGRCVVGTAMSLHRRNLFCYELDDNKHMAKTQILSEFERFVDIWSRGQDADVVRDEIFKLKNTLGLDDDASIPKTCGCRRNAACQIKVDNLTEKASQKGLADLFRILNIDASAPFPSSKEMIYPIPEPVLQEDVVTWCKDAIQHFYTKLEQDANRVNDFQFDAEFNEFGQQFPAVVDVINSPRPFFSCGTQQTETLNADNLLNDAIWKVKAYTRLFNCCAPKAHDSIHETNLVLMDNDKNIIDYVYRFWSRGLGFSPSECLYVFSHKSPTLYRTSLRSAVYRIMEFFICQKRAHALIMATLLYAHRQVAGVNVDKQTYTVANQIIETLVRCKYHISGIQNDLEAIDATLYRIFAPFWFDKSSAECEAMLRNVVATGLLYDLRHFKEYLTASHKTEMNFPRLLQQNAKISTQPCEGTKIQHLLCKLASAYQLVYSTLLKLADAYKLAKTDKINVQHLFKNNSGGLNVIVSRLYDVAEFLYKDRLPKAVRAEDVEMALLRARR